MGDEPAKKAPPERPSAADALRDASIAWGKKPGQTRLFGDALIEALREAAGACPDDAVCILPDGTLAHTDPCEPGCYFILFDDYRADW